jgi:hypothetical protein
MRCRVKPESADKIVTGSCYQAEIIKYDYAGLDK